MFKDAFKVPKLLDLEKRAVFIVNLVLIAFVIYCLTSGFSLRYFFYFDIIVTFIVSYIFFKRSKALAKTLIITNLFIFFYFLYPGVAWFFNELFGFQSYLLIIFYNILIAYVFLRLSGYQDQLFGNLKKFDWKFLIVVLLFGLMFGLLFNVVNEPIPNVFVESGSKTLFGVIAFLIFTSFIVALSEQMIFSGFLFNTYKNLSSKYDAYYQVALIFVMFHMLRLGILIDHYTINFAEHYLLYLISYYVLLFAFMTAALYFYSFKNKNREGNFFYPVTLHFAADFGLFLFFMLGAG